MPSSASAHRIPAVRFALALALALTLAACQGGRLIDRLPADGSAPGARAAAPARQPPPAPTRRYSPRYRGGQVRLTDQDLAPVDAYIHARNSQWILGDVVDVYASREYFASVLTLNEQVGLVHRREQELRGETLVTLTYVGRGTPSAMRNPRAQIGTGLTASARRTLRLHLMKTTNANVPVRLRVVAQGKAVRGRKETTTQRGPTLQLGGVLRYGSGRFAWSPFG